MSGTYVSRFTPSLMSAEALEAIFVQREDLARVILDRVRRASTQSRCEHTLLIGPRGIGKTHLISLLRHRLGTDPDLSIRVAVAWLREEEWGVTSVLDVILRTLRSLATEARDATVTDRIESLYGIPEEDAERQATEILRSVVGERTLVVLAENLDDLFRGLGDRGQFRLRNLLRQNQSWLLVATAQAVWGNLLRPSSPFYGFFQIHPLQGLSLEDATLLLSKIARYTGNSKLAAHLATPLGRSRVRALRHLAGGNHRVYVIFSQFITQESLEDLVQPLVRTIDDLTPYYQSRMASLPPEQRKIVEFVCEQRRPVAAVEVGRHCFQTYNGASSDLEQLRSMGYLHAVPSDGKRLYELREPLMRLSIEVKKQRGEPLRLVIEFLALWYSPSELRQRLSELPREAVLEREYVAPACASTQGDDPRMSDYSRNYRDAFERGDFARALDVAEELTVVRGQPGDWLARASCLMHLGRHTEALGCCDRVSESECDAAAWSLRTSVLHSMGQLDEALASCDKAIQLQATSENEVMRAEILEAAGRYEESALAYQRAICRDPNDPAAHFGCGVVLSDLERHEEALEHFVAATKLNPSNARAFVYLAACLIELKRYDDALASADAAIARGEDSLGWVVRGTALANLSKHLQALEAFGEAARRGDDSSYVQYKQAELLLATGSWRQAATALDGALQRFAHGLKRDAGNTAAMVGNLTRLLRDEARLRPAIKLLFLVYSKNRALRPLAQGLIESISTLSAWQPSAVKLWCATWCDIACQAPEFSLPLRLLGTAQRCLQTRDPRILLELPIEERTLLEPLLGFRALETA